MDWRKTCADLDRDAFARAHGHPFLLVLDGNDGDDQDFRTVIMMATRDAEPGARGEGEPGSVVPLVKTGANPYEGRIIVGRARNCDVVLRDPSVSKFHADLRDLGEDRTMITDRSSRNGTSVNGIDLVGGKPHEIRSGDRVRFGAVAAVYLSPGDLHDALS